MTWNVTLEALMMDRHLPKEIRILMAVQRYAWGNLSDYAVDAMPQKKPTDPKPESLSQQRLGDILGLKAASMSEGVVFLKERGHLRKDHPFLFPEDSVNLLESPEILESSSNCTNSSSPYFRFEQSYFDRNPEARTTITNLDAERKKFQEEAKARTKAINSVKRVILAAWQEEQRKTKDLGNVEKEGGDPMGYCAHAQNESEAKANCTSTYNYGVEFELPDEIVRPVTNSKTPEIRPVTNSKTRKPLETLVSAPSAFKDVNLKRNFVPNGGGGATTTLPAVDSASSSPHPPTQDSEKWQRGLQVLFKEAGKGLPTRKQGHAAYEALNGHAIPFLGWLPESGAFRKTQHGGGLPKLIEIFLADGEPAKGRKLESLLGDWVEGGE